MQKQFNEDFIEEYSEQFATVVCDKFFSDKTHISGQDILTVTPSKQVNFFVIKLLFNNWQEESNRLESPFFDYTANDVKEAMVQFMNVLSRHIKVARKEFEILLQDAVRDTLFFIMSPNAFMEIEMDRKGTEALSQKSAKNIVKYLRISKEAFSEAIMSQVGKDRDDLELDESLITDEILTAEIAAFNEIVPLTLKMLEDGDEFEEDTQAKDEDVEDQLPSIEQEELPEPTPVPEPEEEKHSDQPEEEEPSGDTSEAIEGVTQETRADLNVQEEVTETEEQEEKKVEAEKEPAEEEIAPESELEDEPEIEREEETRPPVRTDIITNLDPEDEDEDDEDAILNSKFEDPMVGSSIAEKHEAEADSMLSAISLNHRYMFINELFDGEADLFAEAIEKVDNSSSFDESVEMLVQNYAKDFHWDMNSDEVKELLKIIFRRFR